MLHSTNTATVALPDLRLARSFAGQQQVVAMRAWYADSFQPVDGAQLYWLSTPSIAGFPFNLGVETQPVSLSAASTRQVSFPQDPQSPTHQRVRADFRRELHSADWIENDELPGDGVFIIDEEEVLRVSDYYYDPDGYRCASGDPPPDDGYLETGNYDPEGEQEHDPFGCPPHDSDYNLQNWRINLSESLRIIQMHNYPGSYMTDQSYHLCPDEATEDGFCLGDPLSE